MHAHVLLLVLPADDKGALLCYEGLAEVLDFQGMVSGWVGGWLVGWLVGWVGGWVGGWGCRWQGRLAYTTISEELLLYD